MSLMASVYFESATRRHKGNTKPSVDSVTLDIQDGEFLVLVGPSGCGKSTTLRMLAGLEPVDDGRILIDGHDQKGVRPRDRDVAMVFQSYALYPNMSAEENMAFALRNAGVSKSDAHARVLEAAEILELAELLKRKPGQLSGGQRQRVAMGRAIVRNPKVFCMDEPLSNLDAKLRVSTRAQIAALQRRLGVTTVYVTHDQTEAMTMGHRVAVLKEGVLQQVDTPEMLYDHPVNTFVAGFIGSPAINLIDATVRDGQAEFYGATVPLERDRGGSADRVTVGIRPESWRISDSTAGAGVALKVELVESLGAEVFVYGRPETTEDDGIRLTVRTDKQHRPAEGDVVRVTPAAQEVHVFDVASGDRL
jgi:ABC-type sugar transport system ATPase subunit